MGRHAVRTVFTALWVTYTWALFAGWLVWSRTVDTFTNWALVSRAVVVAPWLLIALWSTPVRVAFWRWMLPLWWTVAWAVFVGSTVLFYLNGDIFLERTTVLGGSATVGEALLGHAAVHMVPALVVTLYVVIEIRALVVIHGLDPWRQWRHSSPWTRWWCAWRLLYLLVAPLVLPLCYVSLYDPRVAYPTYADWALWLYSVPLLFGAVQLPLHAMLRGLACTWARRARHRHHSALSAPAK